ncbi:polysaccharide pyruvyl transferase family protein [Nonomuraea glycinis]|uniref:polysaccharide pyruvyl transferase family protein n=1 Tax=Nonomuraea glycinis TaxID=2047744 RepID=UPI0033A3F573
MAKDRLMSPQGERLSAPVMAPDHDGEWRVTDTSPRAPHALIYGWFSYPVPGSTAGDLLAKDVAGQWVLTAGMACHVAVPCPARSGEVATGTVDPRRYDVLVFVCGPMPNYPLRHLVDSFPHARKIALNVSLLRDAWIQDKFDVVIQRDGAGVVRPDISFASQRHHAPVIARIYAGPQREYPNSRHDQVETVVSQALRDRDNAVLDVDTKLPHNQYGLTSIGQIESVIRRVDAVVTTRLHGSVLALRNGVPAVVIDAVPGGAKVRAQMEALGWPLVLGVERLRKESIHEALDHAFRPEYRQLAQAVARRARLSVDATRATFVTALGTSMRSRL